MKVRTYPHDVISEKCREKYKNRWDITECIINSLRLYYSHVTKEELQKNREKFVEL